MASCGNQASWNRTSGGVTKRTRCKQQRKRLSARHSRFANPHGCTVNAAALDEVASGRRNFQARICTTVSCTHIWAEIPTRTFSFRSVSTQASCGGLECSVVKAAPPRHWELDDRSRRRRVRHHLMQAALWAPTTGEKDTRLEALMELQDWEESATARWRCKKDPCRKTPRQ